jgi:membrane protein implicated in regulation of membrane protease activity
MEFLTANAWILWICVIVMFLVIEAATVGLTSIWFAVGGLAAMIASLFGAGMAVQFICFLIVSIVALIVTKPLAKRFSAEHQHTNADMIIGMEGFVSERIDNIAGTGAVSVGGKMWTARSTDDKVIFQSGNKVVTIRIEGVKLIVKAAEEATENKEEE